MTDKFINRLTKRHGKAILADLEHLRTNQKYTLQHLGTEYGFSREYARQLFEKIYGYPYGQAAKNKRELAA